MGADAYVKRVLEGELAPEAIHEEASLQLDAIPATQLVHIIDYLTKDKKIPDRDERKFTLAELWNFMRLVVTRYGAAEVIAICDDRSNTTTMKAGTQAKRAKDMAKSDERHEREKAEPYPPGACFVFPDGVCYLTREENEAEDEIEVTEPICMRRLAKSRRYRGDTTTHSNLGNELWEQFEPHLAQLVHCGQSPIRRLMFDYKKDGPVGFTLSGAEHRALPELEHNLGEADPAMMHWLWRFDGHVQVILLDTIDSDIILLYLLHHHRRTEHQRRTTKIYWLASTGVAWDMAHMAELAVQRTYGCRSAVELARAFLLLGHDYTDSRVYSFRVFNKVLLERFFSLLPEERDHPCPITAFRSWMRRAYQPGIPTRLPASAVPYLPCPSMEEIRVKRRCTEAEKELELAGDADKLASLWRFPEDDDIAQAALEWDWAFVCMANAHTGARPLDLPKRANHKRKLASLESP